MLRIPSTALAVALVLPCLAASPARSADLHWFYDGESQNRYEDNEYNNGRNSDRRRIPEPDYSVYQPDDDSAYGQNRNGYGSRRYHQSFSCLQGVENLKQAGFHYIEVVDCSNGTYVYDAVRQRLPWRIEVSNASGEILGVDPLGQ